MLEYLSLKGVGPAPEMEVEFAKRLNVLTGDNGLGKSFILDVAWWALTRTWAHLPAWPHRDRGAKAEIGYRVAGKRETTSRTVPYDFKRQQWKLPTGRPPMPGVVVYARVDGGFSIWDPARNYWRKLKSREVEEPDRPEAYHFQTAEVWDGLKVGGSVVCNGLILDWVSWQRQATQAFVQLSQMLERLSPGGDLPLRPGQPVRVSVEDVREMPTIEMPYGTVPLIHASAGIRRIVALSYLLVWAWREHLEASKLLNQDPEGRLILLFDEVETHLHPTWQRQILPALLAVVDGLTDHGDVQVIAATHGPLAMASLEPSFDQDRDRVFHLDLREDGKAGVHEVPWAKQGDAVGWLVSEVFGLRQARSKEAERAIADSVLDPYDVEDDWFEIHLPSLQLILTDAVPAAIRPRAEYTLQRLHLRDDERVLRQRREWYRMYQDGELTIEGLRGKAPLIARAIERQEGGASRQLASQFTVA